MEHVNALSKVSIDAAYVSIGTFDGVHRGHAALLRPMIDKARQAGSPAVALTFHPHPAIVLGRRSGSFCLSTPEERADLLGAMGMDWVVTEPFTPELANVSAEEFMRRIKTHLGLRALWIGHDFALGKGRRGDEAFLRQLGEALEFEVQAVEAYQAGGVISSTRIRNLLWEGDVQQAASLLGRPYSLAGGVVPGDRRGRTIGIPTANLEADPAKLIPAAGVYACAAEVGNLVLPAAVNIGVRPTFDGQEPTQHIEAHLVDFSGDLYGQVLRLHFHARLRGEQRFSSVPELVAQIKRDIQETRQLVPR